LVVETKAHPNKGRQWEQKRFGPNTQSALIGWLEVRHTFADPGLKNLFVSNTGQALTPDGLGCIFKRLSGRVGFTVGAHDFRRGGATHALKKADSRHVMVQGGWKSAEVFLKYTEQAELDTYAEMMWGKDGY
jgi:site-specific recombinase XerC